MTTTHAGSGTAEHRVWWNMIARCTYPSVRQFKDYGGRGIKVCDRWRYDFGAFLQDMGLRPSPKHSIERKDNHGDYTPENCKWAELSEQVSNKRNNVNITLAGRTMTVSGWSRETGLSMWTIRYRILKGWSPERALSEPPMDPKVSGRMCKKNRDAQ